MIIRTDRAFLNKLSTLFGRIDKLTDSEIKENRIRIFDTLVKYGLSDEVHRVVDSIFVGSGEEKAGTREGALKAWKTRRRSLLDKLKDAISQRDAKTVMRLKQQLASGTKSVQEIYGEDGEE